MSDLLPATAMAALLAGLVTSLLVPCVVRLALVLHAVDRPGGRRLHDAVVPRLGGLAIAVGLACGPGSLALLSWRPWGVPVATTERAVVLVACTMVLLVGVADDLVGVSTLGKLTVQLLAATLIVGVGWEFRVIGLPGGAELPLGLAGAGLTILWIVGVTNAINLLDGLDGLAAGVVAIIAASMLVYAVLRQSTFTAVLMAGVTGACLGFLWHNRAPARIFLGDSGSLTLGFILAVASVHASLKSSTAVAILVPVLALGVPVFDTLLVMLVRFLEQPTRPALDRLLRMFTADTNHLHHLMARHGAPRRTIVLLVYMLVLVTCLMAMVVGVTKEAGLGLALVVVEVAAVLLIRSVGFAREAVRQSERAAEELESTLEPRQEARASPPRE